ncbi:MAG TPA: hypothetical protein VGL35_12415 [Rhizomicrobium sp.]|jgi:hypothetical protein
MTYDNMDAHYHSQAGERPLLEPQGAASEQDSLLELVQVLLASPAGLRRWSVMRAIRTRRERAGEEVPLKFEDEIERLFRRNCADEPGQGAAAARALFYKPKDRAGEVWAANPQRARDWLQARTPEFTRPS